MSTSSIPRSHSVPHVSSLKITTTDLPRPRAKLPRHRSAVPLSGSSTSSFSALYTPRSEREDPFSLGGFFPANLSTFEKSPTEQEWDWLHPDAAAVDSDVDEDRYGREGRFLTPICSGLVSPISEDDEWDIRTPCSALADADDSLARDAIRREDKLGILTLSDKLSLASHGEERYVEDERLLSPYTQAGDPLADEAVYDALRALRTAHSRPPVQYSLLVSNGHAALRSPPASVTQSPSTSHPPPPQPSEPAVSIQSILSNATPPAPASNGQQPPLWNGGNASPRDHPNAAAGPSTVAAPSAPQRSSTKRKLDPSEAVDPHGKIRRVVREHITQDPARVMPMTTVICLHAAVAQKSYGSEKRFLCPPPVVHIEGPVWQMKQQHLSMAVVNEGGERTCELKAPMDQNLTASFKFLHVTGSAKSKNFLLSLDIAEPASDGNEQHERVWASFDSAPVTIISKPSKKTAKTRNIASCILAGGPVSLFNRINSQTVRTKYMTIEGNQLCASNVAWSAFAVNVVRQHGVEAPLGGIHVHSLRCPEERKLTVTAPLIIRKVDKGRIVNDDGGPVSQMQKIALQRINADGSRHYLSAAGPIVGTPGSGPSPPGITNQAGTHPLLFQSPRVREELKDGVRVITDEVDDYLCWTIVGISKFQYTFFDAFGLNNSVPEMPITPFPTLFNTPAYRSQSNTLEMTAANFFYEDPKTKHQVPLDVYVGNIGPLRLRLYNQTPATMDGQFNPARRSYRCRISQASPTSPSTPTTWRTG
ncbi:hypothetical protein BN946_scf185013.g146 [Trametes cinnabarina]|uniref:Uncharacterized protein n=1 Tax=Pycnoporus cinnabarinus TaxID=5643 RepID=A0A060SH32_PYCCI|nr:hypothetical protein BN946_scf185013.g146 [Trametes cinnabarina]